MRILEETNTTQLVKRDGEEAMSIEPRLVQFEVREIESARRRFERSRRIVGNDIYGTQENKTTVRERNG